MRPAFVETLKRVTEGATEADVVFLLQSADADEQALLYETAALIRDEHCGQRMVLRGLLEISSFCTNSCSYCGLNRTNTKAERYRLSVDQILACTDKIWQSHIKTVVMQSGEDRLCAEYLATIIQEIKSRYDMAITLSVGERSRKEYECWKKSGADRYLLRIESSDPVLYASLHRDRSVTTRIRCLDDLQELGYQTGSGFMVGVPGQTLHHIARDILFMAEREFDMIGIGPFIPHPDTPLRGAPVGSIHLTMNAEALIRITNKKAWLPATTAVGSLDKDYRVDVLRAGANVIMPNFSPINVKAKYAIYPGKKCITENVEACAHEMEALASAAGLTLDYSRADSLNVRKRP